MSTYNLSASVPVLVSDPVTAQQIETAQFVYYKISGPILEILGIAANVMNIIVYSKLGYKDPIAVSFSILSLIDLLFLITSSLIDFCRAWGLYVSTDLLDVSSLALAGYLTWYRYLFFDTSTCVETYVAVTRCCCVSMPLKFKNVFTVKKSVVVSFILLFINTVSYVPVITSCPLLWTWDRQKNKTMLNAQFSKDFDLLRSVNNVVNRTTYPVIALVISCVCASILSLQLVKASKWRNRISSKHETSSIKKHRAMFYKNNIANHPRQFETTIEDQVKQFEPNETGKPLKYLSGKDLHIVKCITLVTCNLAFTQLIVSMFALGQAVEQEFMILRRFSKLYLMTSIVMNLVIDTHMLVNIFVYYNFNSKYRDVFITTVNFVTFRTLSQGQAK